MERPVVFVYGTGVRAKSHNAIFVVVRAAIGEPGREVRGCFWKLEEGALFVCSVTSVPGYRASGGGKAETDDQNIAAVTVNENGYERRQAVARAIVAVTLSAASEPGADAVDRLAPNALLAALSSELHSQSRALTDKVWKAAATPALRILSRVIANRHGALSDGMLAMAGDISRYQVRGEAVRQLAVTRIYREGEGRWTLRRRGHVGSRNSWSTAFECVEVGWDESLR
ncbi:hypothetical protein ACGFMK_34925 [Amycolatopsis sp. NPDC049252]|uniref:hypothetical protein n=1 Tax=Amycolatopsis sp. NPDC049252 TaxID=3363933 RepID=UPI0037180F40